MKIGVLSSSRADYSIYYPLLRTLQHDPFFSLEIIVFGTHVSPFHGNTINNIRNDGFKIAHAVESLVIGDSPESVAASIGTTCTRFGAVWAGHGFDLVFCLGDRYEMLAAVLGAAPFNVSFAHLHGGETTLGAIDNSFRHCITLLSKYHFVSTDVYRNRVVELVGSPENVYNVGALSIDNLKSLALYSKEEFKVRFNIDLAVPSILITFHPETISYEKNEAHVKELIGALAQLQPAYQLIITMPNADTLGGMIRQHLNAFISGSDKATGVENFGTVGYLSCMQHCSFMLGNTSSGFVEASYFPKYVINLGKRQDGRIRTPNILDCPVEKEAIIRCVREVEASPVLPSTGVYGTGNAARKITDLLKQL